MATTIRLGIDASAEIREAALATFTDQTGITVTCGDLATADLLLLDEIEVIDRVREDTLEMLGRRAHRAGIDLDDFPQQAIDRFRASDVVYAIPYRSRSHVLIYRADFIASYGLNVPPTWNDLEEAARTARERLIADGHTGIAGFACPAVAGYDENVRLLGSTLFPAWGWRWHRGSGQPPRLASPETVAALSCYAALVRASGPEDGNDLTVATARAHFVAGQSVFLIDDARAFTAARRALGTAAVAIAPVPVGPTGRLEPGLFVPALCIPATTKNVEAAWELLRYLVSPEALLADALADEDPETPRESVFTSAAFAAAFDPRTRAVLRLTRNYARINRPVIPFARAFGEIAGNAARAVITGRLPAGTALREAQETIDALHWSNEQPPHLGRVG